MVGKRRSATVPRSQRNDNFIDKSFTVMADLILKVLPTNRRAKEAFAYYRDGMSAQGDGEYAEALENYQEALKLEDDPNDRAFILYNMALVFTSNGEHQRALEHYQQALDLNSRMPQALNNMAVIHHHLGSLAEERGDTDEADLCFDRAADCWMKAIRLAPNNYIEAQNWLKTTGRGKVDVYF
jgi:tetratricopeptide (TPR) repeat protein